MHIISISINGNCPSQTPDVSQREQTPTPSKLSANSNTTQWIAQSTVLVEISELEVMKKKKTLQTVSESPIFFFSKYSPVGSPHHSDIQENQQRHFPGWVQREWEEKLGIFL